MGSEQKQNDEEREESSEENADREETRQAAAESDENDEADDNADSEEEGSEDEASAAPTDGSETEEESAAAESGPRNRAERRLQAKRLRRGQPAEGNVDRNKAAVQKAAEEADAKRAPAPPPKTVTGKNNADEVPPWARSLVDSMSRNSTSLIAGGLAVLLVAGGAVGATAYRSKQDAEAARLFSEAVDVANGTIRPADAPADPPNSPPRRGRTFAEYPARSRAQLEATRRVPSGAPVAPLAKLSEALALYDLGRYAEAKPLLESVVGVPLGGMENRAIESLGFTLEALNDLPGALRRFEELGRIQDGAWRDTATYHQARILRRQNQDVRAKDLLRGLLERLNRARPDDPSSLGSSSSIYEQAQALLREIDPEDPLGRRRSTDNIQENLLRMLQQRAAGGAGG